MGGLFIEEKHTDFVRDSAYMVHTQNLLIMLHLWVAINVGVRQGRHPVSQDCRVAPLYQDPQSPPEVPDCLTLLLASVTGQGSPQLSHLPLGHLVPATKRLHNHKMMTPVPLL